VAGAALLFIKGVGMGAANVVPGVSGGTIAFITGIYERLIAALRSFDLAALRLLIGGRFRELLAHVDFRFLAVLGAGVATGIVSLAKGLEWLFRNHEVGVWAFFFGLVVASVPFVLRMVKRWGPGRVAALVAGALLAGGLAFLPRAGADASLTYLLVCGVVAMSSMIIPGISGSFVLLLMGNYFLVLGAITRLELAVLVPFGAGCVIGVAALSRLLNWVFTYHHDVAVAAITGFIAGSLLVVWPWKDTLYARDGDGRLVVKTAQRELVSRDGETEAVRSALAPGEELVVAGYRNWQAPPLGRPGTWAHLGLMAAGVVLVVGLEWVAGRPGRTRRAE
jgi:putative membrane protein